MTFGWLFRLCLYCFLLIVVSNAGSYASTLPPNETSENIAAASVGLKPKAGVATIFDPHRPDNSDLPSAFPFDQFASDESIMGPARAATAANLTSRYEVTSGKQLSQDFRAFAGFGPHAAVVVTDQAIMSFAESRSYEYLVLHTLSWSEFSNPTTFFLIAAGGIWRLELACDTWIFDRTSGKVNKLPRQSNTVRMEYLTSAGYSGSLSARDRMYEKAMREIARKLAAQATKMSYLL